MGFTEDYIDAWNSHDEDRFVGQFAPDGAYCDAAVLVAYEGEAEIRRMFQQSQDSYKNWKFVHQKGHSDERGYAVEWTYTANWDGGEEYMTRGVSCGDFDADGRIVENRDYWNPRTFPTKGEDHVAAERAAYEAREKRKKG